MVVPSQLRGFNKIYVQTPNNMTFIEKYERFWLINGNDARLMDLSDVSKWVNDSIRTMVQIEGKNAKIIVWGFKSNKKEVIFSV